MKRTILLTAALLSILGSNAQLNGEYTIGGSSPDYTTIQEAFDDLK